MGVGANHREEGNVPFEERIGDGNSDEEVEKQI